MNIRSRLKSVNVLVVSFVIAGVLIGFLVAAQFQSSVASNTFLADELNAQQHLLDSFDLDRVNLKTTIANLRTQIEDNRKKLELTVVDSNLETLDKLKSQLGLSRISGPGMQINLAEGNVNKGESDANLIHASDLRDLVNLLRTAKVDGISINGQRLINSSTINSLGSTIMVSKVKVTAPFQINVVGDAGLIASRLNDQQSYPDLYKRIKNKSVNFEVQKQGQLVLPAYDGDYLLKYANAN
jgi:uncharacterized protein YlxW (UPF0749 family)